MENQVQIFNFNESEVRTLLINNSPWWVAKDVCEVLGLTNPTMALTELDQDERAKYSLGRQGEANIINEPGLYSLILRSRKPEARAFKRWIVHEVIPTIRKSGHYAVSDESPTVPLANMERAKITRLLQMLDMAEREKLFTLETETAVRKQIAEMVISKVDQPQVIQNESLLPPWEQPEPPHIRYKGRWYKSSEIAVIAGVTVNLIGQLASKHDLRTDEFSQSVPINGDYKSGVHQILYNEKGKNELVRLAELKLASGYVPRTRKKVKRR